MTVGNSVSFRVETNLGFGQLRVCIYGASLFARRWVCPFSSHGQLHSYVIYIYNYTCIHYTYIVNPLSRVSLTSDKYIHR
jgi:hypothetical protein